MPNIDLFDTYTMMGMVSTIAPQQTFFRDRYFPTGPADLFSTNKVLLEYEDSNQKMACFVADKAGDIPVARDEYDVMEFMPPRIAPSRLLTADQLNQRGFGEALYGGSAPAERAQRMHLKDLSDLDARIIRREEWMCAQVLINNGCDVVEYADNQTIGRTRRLKFYEGASSDHIYTVQTKWNLAGGDFFGDVANMCKMLAERGLSAADLVLGGAVGAAIKTIEMVQKLLDNRRMEYGAMRPNIQYPGVAWMGQLNFDGFLLDIFSVYETYQNESGLSVPYFPATSALVTAPGCGRLLYGAITQLEDDGQFHTFTGKRVPKFVADKDKDTRKLRVGARPLAVPRNKLPFIYAENVI